MKLVIFCVILSVALAEYPSNLPKCSQNDEPCHTKAGQTFVDNYSGGLKDIHLLPFDPFHIKSMGLKRDPTSPVNIELEFTDMDMFGMKTMKVLSAKILDFGSRSELEGLIPSLTLKGHYSIDGRVLVLPIVGEGDSEIKCKNTYFKYSYDMKPVEKNGKKYASLEHVKLEIKPELVQFHFENLFRGDKNLGDNMNKFLNENWNDIFQEIKPRFAKALSLEVKALLNTFYSKYPYEEYFQ
ncbi:protein takeout [Stomoxys calcitrans]|uniref:Hemolymph juvenile hormone binding protein n=1 Tax=Stomoxys calcitrans TaxID=35570 RepID=A0A1I8PE76_STOCA|nr:protein takeout [Stomoxys calcitrans]